MPHWLHLKGRAQSLEYVLDMILAALNCFGAGVILTTCFTHMLPDTGEVIEFSQERGDIGDHSG